MKGQTQIHSLLKNDENNRTTVTQLGSFQVGFSINEIELLYFNIFPITFILWLLFFQVSSGCFNYSFFSSCIIFFQSFFLFYFLFLFSFVFFCLSFLFLIIVFFFLLSFHLFFSFFSFLSFFSPFFSFLFPFFSLFFHFQHFNF